MLTKATHNNVHVEKIADVIFLHDENDGREGEVMMDRATAEGVALSILQIVKDWDA